MVELKDFFLFVQASDSYFALALIEEAEKYLNEKGISIMNELTGTRRRGR